MKILLRSSCLWMLVFLIVGCSDPTAPFVDVLVKPATHGILGEVDDWNYTTYYGDFDAYFESSYQTARYFDTALVSSTEQISAAGFYNRLGYLFLPSRMRVFANDSLLVDRYGRLESHRPLNFPGKLEWRLEAGDGFEADTFSMKLQGKVRIHGPLPSPQTHVDLSQAIEVTYDAPGVDSVWVSYDLFLSSADSTVPDFYNHEVFKTANIGSASFTTSHLPKLKQRGSLLIAVAAIRYDSIISKGRRVALRSAAIDNVSIPVSLP